MMIVVVAAVAAVVVVVVEVVAVVAAAAAGLVVVTQMETAMTAVLPVVSYLFFGIMTVFALVVLQRFEDSLVN
jgi:hypothetical protein